MRRSTLGWRRFAVFAALASATVVLPAPGAPAATADYDRGLDLGLRAYEYGVPPLDTNRIFRSSTSVNVPDGLGHGRVNDFSHVRNLAKANEHTVNAPNGDTLYSMAWLNLKHQPQVLHAPPIKGRFWEFEMVDPWTNNFFNVTSAHRKLGRGRFGVTNGGNWAVVGPGFHGALPRGVTRVDSRYNRVWVIGRTYLRSRSDLHGVHAIQNRYSITPLSKFGTDWRRRAPGHPDTKPSEATIPGTQPGEDPLGFYAALGREMERFPPPARDDPLLERLRTVGVGKGMDPMNAGLSADTLQGLRDAVTQGPAHVQGALVARYVKHFGDHNGYLIHDLGAWGTHYELRAIGDRVGIGGQRASIATYPFAFTDHALASLSGSNRYVLHIPPSDLPIPARAFWSLTMYDANSFFVPNALDRYLLNDRSNLHEEPGWIARHLHPARSDDHAREGQLAPRSRRRLGLPADLAPLRPRRGPGRRPRRVGLAAAADPAMRRRRPRWRRNRVRVLVLGTRLWP